MIQPYLAWTAAVLLLISTDIGPEAPMDLAQGPSVTATGQGPHSKPTPQGPRGGVIKRSPLPTSASPGINGADFLHSFKRQSRSELTPCLTNTPEFSGPIPLSAVIDSAGKVRNIKVIGTATLLPDCATKAIAGMDFSTLTKAFPAGTTVTVQWRLDW